MQPARGAPPLHTRVAAATPQARYFHPPAEIVLAGALGLAVFQAPLLVYAVRAFQQHHEQHTAVVVGGSSGAGGGGDAHRLHGS